MIITKMQGVGLNQLIFDFDIFKLRLRELKIDRWIDDNIKKFQLMCQVHNLKQLSFKAGCTSYGDGQKQTIIV